MFSLLDRALAPVFLHPLQDGGKNLEKVYCDQCIIDFDFSCYNAEKPLYEKVIKDVIIKDAGYERERLT